MTNVLSYLLDEQVISGCFSHTPLLTILGHSQAIALLYLTIDSVLELWYRLRNHLPWDQREVNVDHDRHSASS